MSGATVLKAPFPYFGGKSRIASEVWARFGDTPNYVEPFFGSGAVLLARPHAPQIETVNDLDGFVSNFWRAVQADPDAVAHYADWTITECDLHARHSWLVQHRAEHAARLAGDPDYYDAKVAGWWVWGLCAWIGGGWCSGAGPWQSVDGQLVRVGSGGVRRKLPHLGRGRSINRKLPHLGNGGRGINRQLPHLGDGGQGACADWSTHLRGLMQALSDRLRRVRVCSGDWQRVVTPSVTTKHGATAVFLDPPYGHDERATGLYTHDTATVAAEVRAWAIANGDNPQLRIALCGYDTEHAMPDTWTAVPWKAAGGYSNLSNGRARLNAARETVWFSPHCLMARAGITAQPALPLAAD